MIDDERHSPGVSSRKVDATCDHPIDDKSSNVETINLKKKLQVMETRF